MKKILLGLLIALTFAGATTPQSKAVVVIVTHHRHRLHYYHPAPRMVLVPGHWRGPFWHRLWVPAHYVPA